LVIGTALVSVNIWTGAPLFAVWVGSQVQGSSGLSMTAVFSVIAVLAAMVLALAWLLAWLNAAYDELTGRPPAGRQTSPWLRSMRGERETDIRRKHGVSPVERIVVISVVAAVLAFEIWFFFFAGSSLPNQ
jgi:flagellar biogenesis protein FliO